MATMSRRTRQVSKATTIKRSGGLQLCLQQNLAFQIHLQEITSGLNLRKQFSIVKLRDGTRLIAMVVFVGNLMR